MLSPLPPAIPQLGLNAEPSPLEGDFTSVTPTSEVFSRLVLICYEPSKDRVFSSSFDRSGILSLPTQPCGWDLGWQTDVLTARSRKPLGLALTWFTWLTESRTLNTLKVSRGCAPRRRDIPFGSEEVECVSWLWQRVIGIAFCQWEDASARQGYCASVYSSALCWRPRATLKQGASPRSIKTASSSLPLALPPSYPQPV